MEPGWQAYLGGLTDPRDARGAEDFEAIADFGRAKEGFLRSFLTLR